MEFALTLCIYILALIVASLIGAYIPFIKKLNDSQVHLMIALSAGVFLGVLFFLLIPEAFHEGVMEGNIEPIVLSGTILAGFILIMLAELIIKHFFTVSCPCGCDHHEECGNHRFASFSAFIGLGIHAFVDGLILASTLLLDPNVGFGALLGMCVHKFIELFSLSSTFLLSNREKDVTIKYLVAYTAITPIAALISAFIFNGIDVEGMLGIPLAISAGTFMYVALCDMLPEAFHRDKQDFKALVFLVIGLVIAALIFTMFGHSH